MPRRILGLEPTQALLAAQSCAAIIVGYGLALRFDWKASSVATTIIVLQTAALGSTLNKATMRMAGTLTGAVTGLVLVALFAHNGTLFILTMALLTGVCVWGMQHSKHTYAWMLLLLTSAIVGWPAASDPLTTFQGSVDRVTAVAIGVILSAIVQSVFWPVTASRQYERSLRDLASGCRSLLSDVQQGLSQGSIDRSNMITAESELFSLASALDAKLQTARADSKRLNTHAAGYQELNRQLFDMFTAATAISGAAAALQQGSGSNRADLSMLEGQFASIDRACARLLEQLAQPGDGPTERDDAKPDRSAPQSGQSDSPSEQDRPQSAATSLLGQGLIEFQSAAMRATEAVRTAESPQRQTAVESVPAVPAPDTAARLRKSALATLQVLLAAYLFVVINWPLGLQVAMMLVMVLAFLNAQLPVALLARTFLKSVLFALPMAAVFHFVVMPRVDSFVELFPWLGILFFPPLYLAAGPNPASSMAANMSILLTNALISVSKTPPSYDFVSFANTYLGISGGFSVVLFLAYLFETRSPRRGAHKLMASALAQMSDWLETYSGPGAQPQHVTGTVARQQQLVASLGKLRKVAAQIDYGQCPSVSRDTIQSIVRSLEVLGWHVFWAELGQPSNQDAGSDQEEVLQRARQRCAELLAATEQALKSYQPLAGLSHGERLLAEEESMQPERLSSRASITEFTPSPAEWSAHLQYYQSLTSAIADCQRQLNRVDWRRWNQNYF